MTMRYGVIAAAAVIALAGCGGDQTAQDDATGDRIDDATEQPLTDEELAAIESTRERAEAAAIESAEFLNRNAQREEVVVTESGLQYQILEEGSEDGLSPYANDVVEVHYRGVLVDGTEFDSSYSRGEPTTFPLDRVIRGWTEGVQLMSIGDKYRFFIPPELAYGATGSRSGSVGANQALIFDIELLRINPGAEEAQAARERSVAFLRQNAENDDVFVTASGLQYKALHRNPDGGASPAATDRVRVHYRGTLIDGTQFDTSLGGAPAEFNLSGVIPGWTEGLQLMGEGDTFRLFVPSEMGYSSRGAGEVIGPNEALIFDVELIRVYPQ